jgi:hypothetical protein
MAIKKLRLSLNQQGLGDVFLGDTKISEYVSCVKFEATPGVTPYVELTIKAPCDLKTDADVLVDIEPFSTREELPADIQKAIE